MTSDERKKMYQLLAAPFPESCIQRTDGRTTGKGYSTSGIGYQFVVNRLNEAVGVGGWRTHREITVKEITTGSGRKAYEAICDLILELGAWIDGEFQVFAESLADGGHTSTSEADARKGAYTNGLKKAAAMFGCGRQAYEGTLDDDNLPAEETVQPKAPVQPQPKPVVQQEPPHTADAQPQRQQPTRNRISSKQLSAIWAIGRKLGMDQAGIRSTIKAQCSCQPEFLSREQASQVITAWSAKAANGHAPPAVNELNQAS
jgi:hypothetical protein